MKIEYYSKYTPDKWEEVPNIIENLEAFSLEEIGRMVKHNIVDKGHWVIMRKIDG